jgi:hypothetical protein
MPSSFLDLPYTNEVPISLLCFRSLSTLLQLPVTAYTHGRFATGLPRLPYSESPLVRLFAKSTRRLSTV